MKFIKYILMIVVLLNSNSISAKQYYFSTSTGVNTNDGSSPSRPWKTFANLSNITLVPGDSLLLKRGDVWNESLLIDASGTKLKPITISAYGFGKRPSIQPKAVDSSCITIKGEGVKVRSVDLGWARVGIEIISIKKMNNEYLRISDCTFHDMEAEYNSNPYLYNHFSNAILFTYFCPKQDDGMETNLDRDVIYFRDVAIKDCIIENVYFGIHFGETFSTCTKEGFGTGQYCCMENALFQNIKAINCQQTGFSFMFLKTAKIINCDTEHCGYGKHKYGTCGGLIAYSENVIFDGCDFLDTSRGQQPYDGVGFDFEGVTDNIVFKNAIIDGTDSTAIMIFDQLGKGGNSNYLIENVIFRNFARNIGNTNGAVWFHNNDKIVSSGVVKDCKIFTNDNNSRIFDGDLAKVKLSNISINPQKF